MAIKPADEYPNTNPADSNYPGGSAKNSSSPTATDGTPFEEVWVNDLWGFLQALIAAAGITPSGVPDTSVASQYLDAVRTIVPSLIGSNTTITVGAAGDYATINGALAHLSKYTPIYKNLGVTATISLLAGFVMAEQVLVRGLDLGWMTITGVAAETVIDHTALTTDFSTADYGLASYPAFGVSKGGALPRIGQLFRFNVADVLGEKHGVMAVGAGSSADILPGCGVKNAGMYGINATNGATINANGTNASGAGTHGFAAAEGATINAHGADASDAGASGVYADNGAMINADGTNTSGAIDYEVTVDRGSTINADGMTGTLSQTRNVLTANGIIFQ